MITRAEVAKYGAAGPELFGAKPALSGWQVSGRQEIEYAQRVAMDLDCRRNWSLLRDFRIMLRTPRAVVWQRGAV